MINDRRLFLEMLGQTSSAPLAVEIARGEGVYLFSPDGTKYIDLISGVSVSNTGHHHPDVVAAVKKQVDSHLHLMVYGEYIQSPQVRYAADILSLLPANLNMCYFVNSGSEAVEGALKLAKRFTGRSRIVSFFNAYHGSTHGALSVTGSETLKTKFRPLLPDVWFIPFGDIASLEEIDRNTACVIAEPAQAEAGVIWPSGDFLIRLRQKCNETGALLIFDESQTAFGRTGKMFAFEWTGVTPDILVLSKALGGGMPLGAFISPQEVMLSLTKNPALGHITTFGGHPASCAAGMASLGVITRDELHIKAVEKSELFRKFLANGTVKEIRGKGLLLAAETGNRHLTEQIIRKAPEYGLLLDYFLFCDTAFRIAPPLTISNDEIAEACEKLNALLKSLK
ncbi:MAG TPA: aspartate aminotransferase family protein [Bacteroidales bacterium]|nr:aspartate aminotransferase family protein [Bacteroidales bacterium]